MPYKQLKFLTKQNNFFPIKTFLVLIIQISRSNINNDDFICNCVALFSPDQKTQ